MPILTPIASSHDPAISDYLHIRERDLVGREHGFMVEGTIALRLMLERKPHCLRSVFLVEERVPLFMEALARLRPEVPVYTASKAVMSEVAGFPIHRGVLAFAARDPAPSPADFLDALPERALIVAMVGLTNHDNVGGVFRNAAAFGADAVVMDEACCDPLYRKAIRVSSGACLIVPFARLGPPLILIDHLKRSGLSLLALTPGGEHILEDVKRPPRTALLVGAEGPGLPQEVLSLCQRIRIPMAGGFDSLNVATATGIALHALAFARFGE